jgi:hypothetical protein
MRARAVENSVLRLSLSLSAPSTSFVFIRELVRHGETIGAASRCAGFPTASSMGHYCRFCGISRPNEAFSGKGHRDHICKECARTPRERRDFIDQEQEIFGYMEQSHISDKNIERLKILSSSPDMRIRDLASVVLEVALVKPYKTRRLKVLAKERKDLLQRMRETGLIFAHRRCILQQTIQSHGRRAKRHAACTVPVIGWRNFLLVKSTLERLHDATNFSGVYRL